MATFVLLEVVPDVPSPASPSLVMLADRDWLRAGLENGGRVLPARATLIASFRSFVDWHAGLPPTAFLPRIGAFGGQFAINPRYLEVNIRDLDLNLNGAGIVENTTVLGRPGFRFRLQSGVVKLWTDRGFDFRSPLFRQAPESEVNLPRWRARIWPEPGCDAAALWFGKDSVQIEAVGPSDGVRDRRRLELIAQSPDRRVWELSPCTRADVRTIVPGDILRSVRTRLEAVLGTLPGRAVAIRAGSEASRVQAQVFYTAQRVDVPNAQAVRQLVRPDFDVVFTDARDVARWSPRMVDFDRSRVTLHDADEIARLTSDEPVPAASTAPTRIRWVRRAASWSTAEAELPPLSCIGSTTVRPASGFLWQYAAVAPTPATAGDEAPAWIRHEIHEPAETVPEPTRPETIDGAIALPLQLGIDGWRLRIEPRADLVGPAGQHLEIVVVEGASPTLELRVHDADLTAQSPPLRVYTRPLRNPAQPPNAKDLTLIGPAQTGGVGSSALVFASDVAEDFARPSIGATVIRVGQEVRFRLRSNRGAIAPFLPYARAAGIDPVSASSGNLNQTRDPITGRVAIERDVSHGLVRWIVDGDFDLTPARADHPGRLSLAPAGAGRLVPSTSTVYLVLATAPWVVCRDGLEGGAPTIRRSLHFRNLILEHGEFAAASGDRSIDGQPMAVAANLEDFLSAVRDTASIAVPELLGAEVSAAPIVNWLPGAALVTPDRESVLEPRAWLQTRTTPGEPPLDRIPIVHLADSSQTLRILPAGGTDLDLRWLTFDVRWFGWDDEAGARRPVVEMVEAPVDSRPTNGRRRTFAGAVPLLFDEPPVTATALADSVVAAGDESGRIRLAESVTGRVWLTLAAPGGPNSAIPALALARDDDAFLLLSIDVLGRLGAWRADIAAGTADPLDVSLPAHPCRVASMRFVGPEALIAAADDQEVRVWSLDPTADDPTSVPIDGLQGVEAQALAVRETSDGGAALIVGLGATTPRCFLGTRGQTGWTFTEVPFDSPPVGAGSRAVALAEIEERPTGDDGQVGEAILRLHAAVVTNDGSRCDFWRLDESTLVLADSITWLGEDNTPRSLRSVVLIDVAGTPGLQPSPTSSVACLAAMTDADGESASWHLLPRFDDGPTPDVARPPLRRYPLSATPPTVLERDHVATDPLEPSRRPHLVAAGRDGSVRLWDMDAGVLRSELRSDVAALDTLGFTRPAEPTPSLPPGVHAEEVAFPDLPNRPRNDPTSAYRASAVLLTISECEAAPDSGLLIAEGGADDRTEFRVHCRGLLLTKGEGNRWSPVAFDDPGDSGDPRPALPFRHDRGPVGRFGFFSRVAGEFRSLDRFPRLGGLPVHVEAVEWIEFATGPRGADFGRIVAVRLRVALINPSDAAGEPDDLEAFRDDRQLPAIATDAAVATLTLVRDEGADALRVRDLASTPGRIVWRVRTRPVDPAGDQIEGRISRLVGAVEWREGLTDDGRPTRRVALRLDPSKCRAALLGGDAAPRDPIPILTSFGRRPGGPSGFKFGFSLVDEPEEGTSGPIIVQDAPTTVWDSSQAVAAVSTIEGTGSLAVADVTPELRWVDLETGLPWSRASLPAPCRSLHAEMLEAPALLMATAVGLRTWDVRMGTEFHPGRPAPSAAPDADRSPRIASAAATTALAAAGADGRSWVVTGDDAGDLGLWDLATGRHLAGSSLFTARVAALATAPPDRPSGTPLIAAADDDRPEIVLLHHDAAGLSAFGRLSPRNWSPIRLLGCSRVGVNVHLVATDGREIGLWSVPETGPPLDRAPRADGSTAAIEAVSPAFNGDLPGVAYARADGLVRIAAAGADPDEVGESPGPVAALAFFALDPNTHLLVAASTVGALAVRVWTRTRDDGDWGDWAAADLADLPETGDPASAAFLTVGARPRVAAGPLLGQDGAFIGVFDLATGELVSTVNMAGASVDPAAPPIVGVDLDAPHAAIGLEGVAEALVVDLRTGSVRSRVDLDEPAVAARLVRTTGPTLLLTAAGRRLQAWEAASGLAVDDEGHLDPAPIRHLEVLSGDGSGPRTLMVASAVVAWSPSASAPFPDESAPTIPTPTDAISAAAIGRDEDRSRAFLAVLDDQGGVSRVEAWDLDAEPELRYQIEAGAGPVAVAPLPGPDGPHLAVARESWGIDVWTLPPAGRAPLLRWRLNDPAASALAPAAGESGVEPILFAPRSDGVAQWDVFGVWTLDSAGAVGCHLPINLRPPNTDPQGFDLEAVLVQDVEGRARIWSREVAGASRRPLRPRTIHRAVHGLLGDPLSAGGDDGRLIVSLWREADGVLAGIRLEERIARIPAKIFLPRTGNAGVQVDATADLVRLTGRSFQLGRPEASRATTILSGRITADSIRWRSLELFLSDIVTHEGAAADNVLAHVRVAWDVRNGLEVWPVEFQGPTALRVAWGDSPVFTILPVIHRISPFEFGEASPSGANLALPVQGGDAETFDVVGSRRGADNLLDIFVRFLINSDGPRAYRARSEEIPLDTCLDEDGVGSLGLQPEEITTTAHYRDLAARLRYRPLQDGGFDLPSVDRQWLPGSGTPRPTRWLLAPVLRESPVYRLLRQSLVVAPPVEGAAAVATGMKTENLLLIARQPSTSAEASPLVAALESVTGDAGVGPLLTAGRVAEALEGVTAPGVVVHRTLVRGGPGAFRILAREPREDLPAAPTLDADARPASRADFRAVTPIVADRQRMTTAGRYVPVPPPALDDDRTRNWRLFSLIDQARPIAPERPERAPADRLALFISERTAFFRPPLPGTAPEGVDLGPTPAANADSSWFHPRSLDLQLAPDKPGAVTFHQVQGLTLRENVDAPEFAPPTDFAQREPMQIAPPEGADLVVQARRRSVPGMQADRFDVAWVETLGRLDCTLAETDDVPIVQTNRDEGPTPGSVEVALNDPADGPFLRLFLRINDELMEIDSEEARFPIYDARQAAVTQRDLTLEDSLFRVPNHAIAGPDRPDAPSLGAPATSLDAASGPLGGLLLATSETDLKVWSMAAPETPLLELRHPDGGPARAVLATHREDPCVLSTTDGESVGLFLLPLVASRDVEELQPPDGDVIALGAASLRAVRPGGENEPDEVEILVETYAALVATADARALLRVWFRPASGDELRFVDREEPAAGSRVPAARLVLTTRRARTVTVGIEHHRLVLAAMFGQGRSAEAVVWELDPTSDAASARFALPLPGSGVQAFDLEASGAAGEVEQARFFVHDPAAGAILGLDPATGLIVNRLQHVRPPIDLTASKSRDGLRLAAVAEAGVTVANAFRGPSLETTLWNVEGERLLRSIRPTDPNHGLAVLVNLASGLHLATASTDDEGVLQVFDPRLSAFAEPEIFLVSRVERLLDPVSLTIKFSLDDEDQERAVEFSPMLLIDDKAAPDQPHATRLARVFEEVEDVGGDGIFVWRFRVPADAPLSEVDLRWEASTRARFAWVGALSVDGDHRLEARLFEPLANKTVSPIPYSAVAPKIAAVVFIDRLDQVASREVQQRTLFFGDSASGQGAPKIEGEDPPMFAYELSDRESVDSPRPGGATSVGLLLVKYFVNGQVIGAQAHPVELI